MPFIVDKRHHLFSQLDGLLGVIGNPQGDEHIGPSHDAQADLSVGVGHLGDLRQRIPVEFDHIVQKMDGQMHDLFEPLPIDLTLPHHQPQVDGSQVAGLIGEQRLFAAGVGRFDRADMRGGIVPVHPIEKNDPRLPVFPGMPDDQVEDLPGL